MMEPKFIFFWLLMLLSVFALLSNYVMHQHYFHSNIQESYEDLQREAKMALEHSELFHDPSSYLLPAKNFTSFLSHELEGLEHSLVTSIRENLSYEFGQPDQSLNNPELEALIDTIIMKKIDAHLFKKLRSSTKELGELPIDIGEDKTVTMLDTEPLNLLKFLKDAGVEFKVEDLPKEDDLNAMFGSGPRIIGLDTCPIFREKVAPVDRMIGPAGTFNTGTNHLAILLEANCHNADREMKNGMRSHGMRWQVPWGKHTPATWRFLNSARHDQNIVQKNVLPVVTVKDPYSWMGSMCRHSYAAFWKKRDSHCPNLIPNDIDKQIGTTTSTVEVKVRYHNETSATHHESLAGLWNDWYNLYREADFPRLIVRSEDLMLYPKEVVKQICECGGGTMRKAFHYVKDSAKGEQKAHKGASGLLTAIQRYGDPNERVKGFTEDDLEYARNALDANLMSMLGYSFV